jgi:DNA-binding response OmpR family regulator
MDLPHPMPPLGYILERSEPETAEDRKPHTILIIDDDEALADVLAVALSRQGFKTITAGTGESGLQHARSLHPDLIVLDLLLPGADGFSVCHQLADSPETCTIPVIILSGMEQPDILRRCRAAGCRYFVRKPYDPNALLILIRHAIRETASWGQ